jgi:hypothetical protein
MSSDYNWQVALKKELIGVEKTSAHPHLFVDIDIKNNPLSPAPIASSTHVLSPIQEKDSLLSESPATLQPPQLQTKNTSADLLLPLLIYIIIK